MLIKKALITLLAGILISPNVLAWGQNGHRVTGYIAHQYLSEKAQQQVEAILGAEDLAQASTWPDEMRSNPDHFWQRVASPFHYVTVPKGKQYSDVGAPEKGDAYEALKTFAKTLNDPKATLEQKQLALRFTVHIIGDLHQPLHAGDGTDKGGNDVKLKFFRNDSNLHSVWDTGLLEKENLSFTEMGHWLHRAITPEQANQWMEPNPLVWIEESAKIRDTIYPDNEEISWQYQYDHLPMVKQRLQQGGVRMAAYLNALFK